MTIAETADDEFAGNPGAMGQSSSPPSPRDMLTAKLWENPCPFAFRLNYLALLYNGPLYGWVRERYGLSRPEYVVLYSLALSGGGSARDVSATSGFPKNTLSRVIKQLETAGYIEAAPSGPLGGRTRLLQLTDGGWALFRETCPAFEAQERRMLEALTPGERQILLEILSKVVRSAGTWADALPADAEPVPA